MFRRGKLKPFEDLGFRISGWNGEDDDEDACGFYIVCGGYAEEVGIERVEDKGTLIVLTPERFTASNPAHVELANEVGEVLDRAGLLKPLQPWDAPATPTR